MEEMTIFQAIIYGIIQGVGEFLPISSSGHLAIMPYLFGWQDQGVAFDSALHMGTLIAVIVFFWKDWFNLGVNGLTKPKSNDGKLFWFLVLATIPAGVVGLLLSDKIEVMRAQSQEMFTTIIGIMLILIAIVLLFADKYCQKNENKKDVKEVGLKDAIIIGLSQAVAIIPGTSRSGITMSAGLFRGLNRESAARFSFLLSTPIIVVAAMFGVKDFFENQIAIIPFIVALLTSAVVGFLSIKFLLKFLQKHGFKPFVIYRIILGIILILLPFIR